MSLHPPHVFWLFGLSGAGKSTLATELLAELRARGRPVLALDGDSVRAGLCRGLGFTDGDRAENLRRSAEVARLALESDLDVVASFITPLESHRKLVSDVLGPGRVSFVFLDAPLEVCRRRDVKGLYAGARQGTVAQMTGMTSRFEPGEQCALRIDTASRTPERSAAELKEFALNRLGAK